MATQHEAHKYVAVAHKLLGQVSVARGDMVDAEKEFSAALDELREFPAPLVTWKTYAEIGRLKTQSGNSVAAREAFAEAAKIVNSIAANIEEENANVEGKKAIVEGEKLRETFLNSAAVQAVLNGAARSVSSQ